MFALCAAIMMLLISATDSGDPVIETGQSFMVTEFLLGWKGQGAGRAGGGANGQSA